MGMRSSLDMLRRVTAVLEKTVQAWYDASNGKKRKRLEGNVEYLLREAETFYGEAKVEWRSAFPLKPLISDLGYDEKLQRKITKTRKKG